MEKKAGRFLMNLGDFELAQIPRFDEPLKRPSFGRDITLLGYQAGGLAHGGQLGGPGD